MGGVSHRARVASICFDANESALFFFLLALSLMAHVRAAEEPVRREWTVERRGARSTGLCAADGEDGADTGDLRLQGTAARWLLPKRKFSFHALWHGGCRGVIR